MGDLWHFPDHLHVPDADGGDGPAENLLTIDGAPARLWVAMDGNVRLETLEFGSKTGGFQ